MNVATRQRKHRLGRETATPSSFTSTSSTICARPVVVFVTVAAALCRVTSTAVVDSTSSTTPTTTTTPTPTDAVSVCPARCVCSLTTTSSSTVSGHPEGSSSPLLVNCSTGVELSTPTFRLSNRTGEVIVTGYPVDLLSLSTVLLRDCTSTLYRLSINVARLQSLNGLAAPESLRGLDLSRNFLSMLADRAFIRVATVRRLDLSANRIESINHEAFYGLTDLVELDLSVNRLGTTMDGGSSPARWICFLPSIERLNVSRNGYHMIHDSFFDCRHHRRAPTSTADESPSAALPFVTSSPPLRDLDLGHNRIRHVTDGAFAGLDGVDELRLNDNALVSLPVAVLRQMRSFVSGLDLSGNDFDVFEAGSFRDVGRLERLRLERLDRLRLIERHAFANMTALRVLGLSHCRRLRYVSRDAFVDVPSLAELDLSGCDLETLEEEFVEALPALRRLDVRSNPLSCDCTTGWMWTKMWTSWNRSVVVSVDGQVCRTGSTSDRSPPAVASRQPTTKLPFNPSALALVSSISEIEPPVVKPTAAAVESTQSQRNFARVAPTASLSSGRGDAPAAGVACRARILSMFDDEVTVSVTDTLRLDCIAVGRPALSTSWILPVLYDDNERHDVTSEGNGEMLMDEDDDHTAMTRIQTIDGTLFIRAVTTRHHGNYTCLATVAGSNGSHADERTVRVRVRSSNTGLIVLRMTSSTLTVTWRGLQPSREYRVRYHERNRNRTAGFTRGHASDGGAGSEVIVKPYMRSFTASDLRPDTDYVFCIDIRQSPTSVVIASHVTTSSDGDDDHQRQQGLAPFVTVNCSVVTTRNRKYADQLVRNRGLHILVVCVTAFASASLVVVVATAVTRRYDRRRRRHLSALQSAATSTSSVALDASSQLRLTPSAAATGRTTSSWTTAPSDVTFENRAAIECQLRQEQQEVYSATEQDDYDYVPMFDSDDLEEIRMTTSMQL